MHYNPQKVHLTDAVVINFKKVMKEKVMKELMLIR